jgi:hypothetical protein
MASRNYIFDYSTINGNRWGNVSVKSHQRSWIPMPPTKSVVRSYLAYKKATKLDSIPPTASVVGSYSAYQKATKLDPNPTDEVGG